LEAFLVVSVVVIFDLIAVMVGLLVPPPRTWTWRSAIGGFMAAIVSAAHCLFLSTLDPDTVAPTSDDTATITIVWLVAWIFFIVFTVWAERSDTADSR
jgi:hypothetical protein